MFEVRLIENQVARNSRKHGLSESDPEKFKGKQSREPSEETRDILKRLEISKGEMEKALIKSDEDYKQLAPEKPRKEKLKAEPKKSDHRKREEEDEETLVREEIEKFLRERALSQSFITTFLKVGYTEEFHRLLNAMGFAAEDTEELQRLWELEARNREEIDSLASLPSSSNEYLSSDGLYLKNLLSKPLSRALKEVVAKKPFDPVEYLGHWLLNYKICEERKKRRREFQLELMIERERFKPPDEEKVEIEEEEEEEEEEEGEEGRGFFDDWSFVENE